jgi:hypothetical protein
VSSYTITITPDDSTNTTTLRLDVSGSGVRMTDLHLHADDGLSTGQLPAIDFGLLLRAINPATGPAQIAATPAPVPDDARPVPEVEDGPSEADLASAAETTRPGRGGRRRASKSASGEAKDTRTRRSGGRKGGAGRAAATKGAKATATKKTSGRRGGGGRAYRRMPEDFAAVYEQVGSAARIAEHYDVPRHTAHGWIRRIREQGSSTVAE